jgi:hypothetical protein
VRPTRLLRACTSHRAGPLRWSAQALIVNRRRRERCGQSLNIPDRGQCYSRLCLVVQRKRMGRQEVYVHVKGPNAHLCVPRCLGWLKGAPQPVLMRRLSGSLCLYGCPSHLLALLLFLLLGACSLGCSPIFLFQQCSSGRSRPNLRLSQRMLCQIMGTTE